MQCLQAACVHTQSPGCTHTHPTISRLYTNTHTDAPTPVPGARTGQGKVGGESTLAPRIATDGAHRHQTGKHLQGTMAAVACPPSNGLRSILGGACARCLEGPSPDEQTWLPLWGFLRPPTSTPGCTAALSWPPAPRPLCPAIPPRHRGCAYGPVEGSGHPTERQTTIPRSARPPSTMLALPSTHVSPAS